MGLLEDLSPDLYTACPKCSNGEIKEETKWYGMIRDRLYCEDCGYEPEYSEVAKLLNEENDISNDDLKQQVRDRQDEGWEINEITDSGRRVVMSSTKGGTIGGHALTGVLTGLWTFGMGNVAYNKLSEKNNKERIVLRADDESNTGISDESSQDSTELLQELNDLNEKGLITGDEFKQKKQEILDRM